MNYWVVDMLAWTFFIHSTYSALLAACQKKLDLELHFRLRNGKFHSIFAQRAQEWVLVLQQVDFYRQCDPLLNLKFKIPLNFLGI